MPVFWYLKAVSSLTWSSIVSFRKFILFGGFLAYVSSLLQLSCLGLTGHLYLKLTTYVNNRRYQSPRTWCYLRWLHGPHRSYQEQQADTKMAPTIGGICEDQPKDSDDVIKEQPKISNKQGKIVLSRVTLMGHAQELPKHTCRSSSVHCLLSQVQ